MELDFGNVGFCEHEGELYYRAFSPITEPGSYTLKLKYVSMNSPNLFIIDFSFEKFKGKVYLGRNQSHMPQVKLGGRFPGFAVSHDQSPEGFEVNIEYKTGNIWFVYRSRSRAFPPDSRVAFYKRVMRHEQLGENLHRFHCNDQLDYGDFNDFVFDLEVIKNV